eukprot:CAMPEP_0171700370 /NCGR_PEP_ID=MMETSP0991-20121206/10491_1 /TAXON_ID=483369 /ORGANISM="non described non described, Strain CCMP2098" /LENGTH=166 /DNA_ID=CAMNT_0012289571 /DNA_START=45 /DNA_END=542 /DNA_ORIENTATION=+
MAPQAFFRIGYFVAERVAEPLSIGIQGIARQSGTFRSACIKIARSFENTEIAKESRHLKSGEKLEREMLTPEEAVERGAEILGEGILWGAGLAVVVHQFWQDEDDDSTLREEAEERHKATEAALHTEIKATEARLMARIDTLEARVLSSSMKFQPLPPKSYLNYLW